MSGETNDFGAWFTQELDARGITSNSAAGRLIGVSHTSIRKWKTGVIPGEVESFEAIARGLGIPTYRVLAAAKLIPPPDGWERPSLRDVPIEELLNEMKRRAENRE